MNYILWLILILNIVITIIFNRFELSLVSLANYFWHVQILLVLFFFDKAYFAYSGLIFIEVILFLFSCTYYSRCFEVKIKKIKFDLCYGRVRNCLVIGIFISFIYVLLKLYLNGFSVRDFLSLDSFLQMNHSVAVSRYSGSETYVPFHSLFLAVLYTLPLLLGFLKGYYQEKNMWRITFFSFLPVLLVVLIENTKAVLIGSVIFSISAYLVGYYVRTGKYYRFSLQKVLMILGTFDVFILFLLFTMMARIGKFDLVTFNVVVIKFLTYSFGHLFAFDSWFSLHLNLFGLNANNITFIGMLNSLGLIERSQGIFNDYYDYSIISTNVYTYFRGFVSDVGIIGTAILAIVLGLLSRFMELLVQNYNLFVIVTFVFFYSFTLYYIVSLFSYFSFIASFLIFYLCLIVCSNTVEDEELSYENNK